ncbi:MAG: CoA ester lyase [Solirubrobacteraceae bacterium]
MTLPFRSLLFVPADDPELLRAAFAAGTDAVVADLEDAVAPGRKHAARATIADLLPTLSGAARLVRVNAPDTGLCDADLDAIAGLELDAVLLPKATPEGVAELGSGGPPLIAIIETGAGVRAAYDVAVAPRVAALGLGAADLSIDLRLEARADSLELLYVRSKLVVDSAAAGIRAPFDRVFPDLADDEGLRADARLARSLGFGGKNCRHVSQPAIVNDVFG